MLCLISICWSQAQDKKRFVLIKALCGLIITQGQVKICRRERLPSWCMGEHHVNLHRSAIERKVVHLEELKIVFIDLKWIYAQGKGKILIGFLFYRSHEVECETGL